MQTAEISLNNIDARMDEPELKIVDIFICKLRKRLNEVKGDETHIQTV
jgi:two-component system, cell cycle response regulator CtrA